jgi:hypothetical protein
MTVVDNGGTQHETKKVEDVIVPMLIPAAVPDLNTQQAEEDIEIKAVPMLIPGAAAIVPSIVPTNLEADAAPTISPKESPSHFVINAGPLSIN